jgi:hypothetical protein
MFMLRAPERDPRKKKRSSNSDLSLFWLCLPNMPNTPRRYKKNRSSARRRVARILPGGDSVKSLLGRPSPVLASIADQVTLQRQWREWLDQRLPAALHGHITGLVEARGELVIFTASAGWGVRLRYAIAELESELRREHPSIASVAVRVLPGRTHRSS